MTKEAVLAAFELDIQRGDPKVGDSTVQDIKKTARGLIVQDRTGVIEALRYWLQLRDIGLTITALDIIADIEIPELKQELIDLRVAIASGKVFHPSYNYWVDRALKKVNNIPG